MQRNQRRNAKGPAAKSALRLPDLEVAKSAVLNTLSFPDAQRGYRHAYREFYRWGSIARGAAAHDSVVDAARHFAYAAGWKKFERMWDWVIRARRVGAMLPALELILGRRTGPTVPSGTPSNVASGFGLIDVGAALAFVRQNF